MALSTWKARGAEPAAALRHLQAASRFDLALGGTGFNGFFGGLYPVYVRGQTAESSEERASIAG